MTELKAKPKIEDYLYDAFQIEFVEAERDYYRDALAVAVEALENISANTNGSNIFHIQKINIETKQALSTIKGSRDEN